MIDRICDKIKFIFDNNSEQKQKIMNYLSQTGIIQKISQKITQPKQALYSEQPIFLALSYIDTHQYVDAIVYNKYQERLKVSLFFNQESRHQSCIVYMHGYGSNRMEAIFLLKYLPANISMCCFDFSAEGKSDGKIITFGQKQKDDIKAVLGYLRTSGYKKFILWGRSMGATCTLLHNIKYKPHDVILQILDSPFISFNQAALQLTKKRISIPQIIIKLALEALCKNLQNKQYNPFQIDLNKTIQCDIPAVFMYSDRDEVINPENSRKLISNFKGHYEKIVINQLHNAPRKNDTIKNLMNLIKKYIGRKSQNLKQNFKQVSGNIQNYIKAKNSISQRSSLNNYGIWVSTKEINDDMTKQRDSQRVRQVRSTNSHYSRPKSSIKVYSKISKNSQSCNFQANKEQVMSTKSSYERQRNSIKNRLRYDFYL